MLGFCSKAVAWVTLLAFLNGCASQAFLPYASAPTPERTIPREIAVTAARFPPQAKVALLLRSKGELAASGAASGAAEGTHVLMAGLAPAGELGALVAMLLLPVFAGVGAAIGAARDAPSAASAETIESGRRSVQEGIAHLDLQRSLQARVAHELRARGVAHRVEEVHDVGPTTPDEAYAYAEPDPIRQEAILEIAVLGFEFVKAQKPDSTTVNYALLMKTRSRLLAPSSRAILDELHYLHRSDPHTANEWLDDGAALFSLALRQAVDQTAQGVVHEMFLLYYPARALAAKASADEPIPPYVLRPLDHVPKRARGLRAGFIDKYLPSKSRLSFEPVDSLQPTLR